jgi:hypothetical protein
MKESKQNIAITNLTSLDDNGIIQYIDDLQYQIDQHCFPFWNTSSRLYFIPKDELEHLPIGHWRVAIVNTSGSELHPSGDHTYDQSTDTPFGYIYAEDASYNGVELSIVISHEILEMLVNPKKEFIMVDKNQYMKEICDPIGDTTYFVNDTEVSNFVTPSWFRIFNNKQYDYLNLVRYPLGLLEGGSIPRL